MSNKGICLDLDNTLYDYSAAHKPALEESLRWLCQALNRERESVQSAYAQARQRVNHDLHGLASSHSRLLYFQGVCEYFGASPYETAVAAEDRYWQNFFENMHLRPGVLEFFQSMKNTPIVIVTDLTTRIQFQKITHLQLAPLLKAIVTSEEAGHEKPHPRIFELAADKLQVPPADLCMIGDSWERDIEGALKFGMRSFWFREDSQDWPNSAKRIERTEPKPELVTEFNDFYALPQLIDLK